MRRKAMLKETEKICPLHAHGNVSQTLENDKNWEKIGQDLTLEEERHLEEIEVSA